MARRRASVPDPLSVVEFLGNGEADWALFSVRRADCDYIEQLYALRRGDKIVFGRALGRYNEGVDRTPWSTERIFSIAVLRRLLDNGIPRTTRGTFQNKTDATVDYRTDCGEIRRVRLDVLRAIIEDAKSLPG